jgi:rubrerythrin
MALVALLDLAIELEEKISEIYELMSRKASGEALRTELVSLSHEEVDHANLLRAARNFALKDEEFFSQKGGESGRLNDCLTVILGLINELDSGTVTLKSALSRTVALEYFCEKAHLSSLVSIEEASLAHLFKALAGDDAAHAERVWQLLRQHQDSP